MKGEITKEWQPWNKPCNTANLLFSTEFSLCTVQISPFFNKWTCTLVCNIGDTVSVAERQNINGFQQKGEQIVMSKTEGNETIIIGQ